MGNYSFSSRMDFRYSCGNSRLAIYIEPIMINILGIPYELCEVDVIDKNVHLVGQINYQEQKIQIEKGLGEDYRKQTIMHEVLHGIFEALGYDDINADEQKVQSISSALHQVFGSQITFS